MSSMVIAHAGQQTQVHVMVDTLLGVAFGLTVVVLYYLLLRYVVGPERRKRSSG